MPPTHQWQTLTPDQVSYYRLGVEAAVAKQFEDWDSFARELYYARLVHEQPWASDGFLKPLGYRADPEQGTYLVFYSPMAEATYERLREREDCYTPYHDYIARSIYWLARAGLFLRTMSIDSRDVGFCSDGAVRLANYQLAELSELDQTLVSRRVTSDLAILQQPPDQSTPEQRRQAWNNLVVDSFRPVGIKYSAQRMVWLLRDSAVNPPPWQRPSLLVTFRSFSQRLHLSLERPSSGTPRQIGMGGYGIVYEPPIDYEPVPGERLVGKVFFPSSDDEALLEEEAVARVDQLDPRGEFHPRVVAKRMVEPPAADRHYYGRGKFAELVYEYGGESFDHFNNRTLTEPERLWFYLGLERFLGFLERLADARLVHYDLRVSNLLVDEWFNVRVVDFGLLRSFECALVISRFSTPYYPLELVYVYTDRSPKDALKPMVELWTSWVDGTYRPQNGVAVPDNIERLHRLHELDRDGIPGQLERFTRQLNQLSLGERWEWILSHVDGYMLGLSMLVKLRDQSIRDELKPVLYHLVAYDLHERSLCLARYQLRKLIARLEERLGVPIDREPLE